MGRIKKSSVCELGLLLVLISALTCVWINIIFPYLLEKLVFLNYINIYVLFYFLDFMIYWILGMYVSKNKEKKKQLILATVFEIGANMVVLMPWLLFYVIPTEHIPVFIIDEPIFYMWYQNPISFAVCWCFAESSAAIPAVIATLLSPAPVGFVYLFSKTPLLFKFLKRIRIKISGKSITLYLKDVETKQ